ncbi:hypothetical protein IJ596_00070 [bacterium]|nr:hypothetical protein [bacterium]
MSRNSINKKPIVSAQMAANNNNKVQQQKPQAKTSQNTSIFKSEQNVGNKSNSKSKTIALQSGRKVVIKDGKARYYAANGTELNQKYFEKTEGKVQIMASGRYTVTKNGQTKYYAANGTELKAEYFKKAESGQIINVKTSKQKTQTLNTLIRAGNEANKEFKKQLADDGWAGDVADGISVLWGSDNRASKVRVDIDTHNKNMQALKKAASQGDEAFEKKFKEIFGVNYNQKAIDEYNRKPSDANYQKAFGTKQVNLKKRVREYNQSQQTGAEVVKTTGKVAAGIAVGVATGGTGFVALGAAAIGTGLASVTIDETDRMKVKDLVQKGEVNFREGTNHKQILKDAAFDAGAVFIGGAAAKAAKVVVKGTQAANAAGQVTEVLTKGQKAARAGITIGADVAVGAGQEYATTGDVTLGGTLMNAAMSGVGSAVEFGAPQKAWKGIKRAFGNSSEGVSKRFTIKKSQTNKSSALNQDPDADLDRFLHMGPLIARGTNDVPKQGLRSKLHRNNGTVEPASSQANTVTYGGRTFKKAVAKKRPNNDSDIVIVKKETGSQQNRAGAVSQSQSNSGTVTYGGRTFKKAIPRSQAGTSGIERPKSKPKVEAQNSTVGTSKPQTERQRLRTDTPKTQSSTVQPQEIKYNYRLSDGRIVSTSLKIETRSDGLIFLRNNEGYIQHRLANREYTIIENSGQADRRFQKLENVDGKIVITDVSERDYRQYLSNKRGIQAGAAPVQNAFTERNVRFIFSDNLGTKGSSGHISHDHTHFVETGKSIDLSYGQLEFDYEVYTASGNTKRTMVLNRSGIIEMPNGATHNLIKDGPYYYGEDVAGKSFKKIEYVNGKAKISNVTKEEYQESINKKLSKAPVRKSVSLESLGNRTMEIQGTYYSITGRPSSPGFIVKNKHTGEYTLIERGESFEFKDGTTISCSGGVSDNFDIRIEAKRIES